MISAIIQARLGSTRLPRKVLLEIPKGSGATCLDRVIEAVKKSMIDRISLTTPDKELFEMLWGRWPLRVHHYAGKERNVIAEFFSIAIEGDTIVRITADCPMLDSDQIDKCIDEFLDGDYDLVYNTDESITMDGDGTDVEVFSYKALREVYLNATGNEKEHVTLWMRRNLKCKYVPVTFNGCSLNNIEDYERICKLWTEKEESDKICQSTQTAPAQAGQM
ncbi:MAG: hypothetical protein MUO31_06900 [Thermodesulfovibrionales bacterium]|nr:hypothetical protein [Thermodesulfovibrionales bacterium]